MNNRPHVVTVGAGFAGLNCACKLASHADVRVTLIDKNNYQQFQPLLYQSVFHEFDNVDVKMAEVVSADFNTRTVRTSDGQSYRGDYLMLAAGSRANFFNTPGAEEHALPYIPSRKRSLFSRGC